MTNRERIRQAVKEIIRKAPAAAAKSFDWSACLEAVEYAVNLETTTLQMRITDEELLPYLEQIIEKRNFIRAILRGRRERKKK